MKSPYDVVYTVLITEKDEPGGQIQKYLFGESKKPIKLKSSQLLKQSFQM